MANELSLNKQQIRSTRSAGIDLLKLLAMLTICIAHAINTGRQFFEFSLFGGLQSATTELLFQAFLWLGNILFVTCSSYYLADERRTKSRKVIEIIFDAAMISITICVIYLCLGYRFGTLTMIKQFFPTLFANNWFVPCYLLFYMGAPLLRDILRRLGRKSHFAICLLLFFIYCVLSVFNVAPIGSYLVGFFVVFVFVAFAKWYLSKPSDSIPLNLTALVLSLLLLLSLVAARSILNETGHTNIATYLTPNTIFSPFTIAACIALLNLFRRIKLQSTTINYLGSCTLFVYLIHENYLLRTYARTEFYNYVFTTFGTAFYLGWFLLTGVFMFAGSLAISAIYRATIHRLVGKLSFGIDFALRKTFNAIYIKIFG